MEISYSSLFRGPKLSRSEHTKQFHKIIFTISAHFLESFSSNYTRVGSRYDDDGTSLDKRPVGLGKAHLELLVAACNNF